jgi:hypothetical protein
LTVARRSDGSDELATDQRRASDSNNGSNNNNITFDTLGILLLL